VVKAYLVPRIGAETPLRDPRDGRDTFSTDDVDEFRRELLATHLAPRTVQKVLRDSGSASCATSCGGTSTSWTP
jgi:hypothetical protein